MTVDRSTFAALLTPLAPGAIATIGLAGGGTDAILDRILRSPRGTPVHPEPHRPVRCRIVDGGRIIDDAIVVRITSQRMARAEIHTHGGVRIVQRVLRLLEGHGAEIIDGRLYIERAEPAGRIERDADRSLIEAGSRRLADWLMAQRAILPEYLTGPGALDDAEQTAFRARSRVAIRLIEGLHMALIGPPNAGKSSLANRLIGRDRAITSSEAGTTRDWVSETALIAGWPVTLTDTAGLRETTCRIEAEAIRRARERARSADAIVIVLDATQPADDRRAEAQRIMASLPEGQRTLLTNNKCDLPGATGLSIERAESCTVSALTGEGMAELEERLCSILGLNLLDASLPTAFTRNQIE